MPPLATHAIVVLDLSIQLTLSSSVVCQPLKQYDWCTSCAPLTDNLANQPLVAKAQPLAANESTG